MKCARIGGAKPKQVQLLKAPMSAGPTASTTEDLPAPSGPRNTTLRPSGRRKCAARLHTALSLLRRTVPGHRRTARKRTALRKLPKLLRTSRQSEDIAADTITFEFWLPQY